MKFALALLALCLAVMTVDAQCKVHQGPSYPVAPCAPHVTQHASYPSYQYYAPFSFEFRPVYAPVLSLPGLNTLLLQPPVQQVAYQQPAVEQSLALAFPAITGSAETPILAEAATQKPTRGQVLAVLSARCASCHSSPGKDGVFLFSSIGEYTPNIDRGDIYRAAVVNRSSGRPKMPPDGPLPQQERSLLAAWKQLGWAE